MNNKIKLAVGLLVVVLGGVWFYYTPYLAYRGMLSAAEAGDGEKLARYVDFPSVKDSIRAAFAGFALRGRKAPATPNLALFNTEADTLASPAGLAVMGKGGGPDSAAESTPSKSNVRTAVVYETYDQVVVNVSYLTRRNPAPVGLVFRRNGLFAWKLFAMRLPL